MDVTNGERVCEGWCVRRAYVPSDAPLPPVPVQRIYPRQPHASATRHPPHSALPSSPVSTTASHPATVRMTPAPAPPRPSHCPAQRLAVTAHAPCLPPLTHTTVPPPHFYHVPRRHPCCPSHVDSGFWVLTWDHLPCPIPCDSRPHLRIRTLQPG